MKYETHYAQSGDHSLAYQIIGSGPRDLIYVPGIISHVEFFHELPGYSAFMEGLASFARVIVFDKLGNGMSDRVSGAPSLEQRIDDIPAIMDAVGSKRATLFAVSEGGPISLLYAATHPERIESIVLYETFASYGGVQDEVDGIMPPDMHKIFTDFMITNHGKGQTLAGFGGSYLEGTPEERRLLWERRFKGDSVPFPLDARVQELWGRAERLSNSPGGFRAVYEMLLKIDVRAALPLIKCPVLILHAANRLSMFDAQNRYLETHIPNARRVALDGVDHFPWFAEAEKVVAETEEFVTGVRSHISGDRALSTLLFLDISDSTKLAAEMGDRRWREITQSYYTMVRRELTRFRGIEFGMEGDGVFARFDGPARAVSCACVIRDGVHDLGLKVHAGLHTGEVQLNEGEVSGIAANIAARVVAIATADQVLVTRTVKDLVIGSGLQFKDFGTHQLKGVPDSWQLYVAT